MYNKYVVVSKRIARWKHNNPVESFLGNLADRIDFFKRLYVLYYKIFDNTYYRKGKKFIQKEIDENINKVPFLTKSFLKRDMIYSLHRFGASFNNYYTYCFYNLNAYGRQKFLTDKLRWGYVDLVNEPGIYELLDNKWKCYCAYKRFYKREVVNVESKDDFVLAEKFVKRNNKFVYKPIGGFGGTGVQLISLSDKKIKQFLEEHLKIGPFVLEELIDQDERMKILHPSSINTIRICTFTIGDEVYIIAGALRMGRSGSFVDNGSSGGILANVNVQNGVVDTPATDYKGVNYIYYNHPTTNEKILGFEIPEWNEAKSFIKEIALNVKGATIINWDIALTNNGWCMVEANGDMGDTTIQISGLGLNDTILHLMDEFFKRNER